MLATQSFFQDNPTPFTATGGTITYVGDYTIHTFTDSGTFTPASTGTVDWLVVAGGGGGSYSSSTSNPSNSAGARESHGQVIITIQD